MKYYCSTKFTELQVYVQSRLLQNCCKAWPERIELDWLKNNPGKLFHTPTMVQDRKDMLEDKSTKACHHGCYKYEEKGLSSKRTQNEHKIYINDPYHPLIELQISLSNDCNLTCAYCSSDFSSAWYKDIKENGKYDINGYEEKNNNWFDLWAKIKQKNRSTNTQFFHLLLREIELAKNIKKINILGGEPLLNNELDILLDHFTDKTIRITSGLGVSMTRLENILKKIKNKNVEFSISAESTGKQFEFIRYGSHWGDFLKKIEMIKNNGNNLKFGSTINNLSIFSIKDFYELMSKNYEITFNSVTDRPFLEANVLDDRSKEEFIESIDKNINFYKKIVEVIKIPCKEEQRKNLSVFLKEFSRRRKLSLDVFPEHFLRWLEII